MHVSYNEWILVHTMVNSTQLNFGIEILRWLRGQWPKLHLGLNALSNQKILKGIYYVLCTYLGLVFGKNDFETTSLSRKLVYYLGKTKIFTHFGKPDFKATNCRLYLLGVVPSGLCINCLIKVCKLLFFWKFCFSTKGQIPWDKIINQKKVFLPGDQVMLRKYALIALGNINDVRCFLVNLSVLFMW